jgi:hypothetical protein
VPAPDLALAIREAQVEVHTIRGECALESDHLKIALENRGLRLAGTLEGRLAEIAHHADHKTVQPLLGGVGLQAAVQIAACIEVERQGTHAGTIRVRSSYVAGSRGHNAASKTSSSSPLMSAIRQKSRRRLRLSAESSGLRPRSAIRHPTSLCLSAEMGAIRQLRRYRQAVGRSGGQRTCTPFQNATRPRISAAAGLGSG